MIINELLNSKKLQEKKSKEFFIDNPHIIKEATKSLADHIDNEIMEKMKVIDADKLKRVLG